MRDVLLKWGIIIEGRSEIVKISQVVGTDLRNEALM